MTATRGYEPTRPADFYGETTDPFGNFMRWRRKEADRIHVGETVHGTFVAAPQRTSVLVTGLSQSVVGKTSGCIVPAALATVGTLILITTKPRDTIDPTLATRLRLGNCYHFPVDGAETPQGMDRLSWSPLAHCDGWDDSLTMADVLVESGQARTKATSGYATDNSEHFASLATGALAVALYMASARKLPMSWVVDTLIAGRVHQELASFAKDHPITSRQEAIIENILHAGPNERGSIATTSKVKLSAYLSDKATALTNYSNVDLAEIIAGNPDEEMPDLLTDQEIEWAREEGRTPYPPRGRYDTIYISAGALDQRLVAPIIVAFLQQVRKIRYRLSYTDEQAGIVRPPMTVVIDEMAHVAPDAELPKQLGEGASQGVLSLGALQSFHQAALRWGKDTMDSFLSLWQTQLILPGVRDTEIVKRFSEMAGQYYDITKTFSETYQVNGDSTSALSDHVQRLDRLPVDHITNGHPSYPGAATMFNPGGGYGYVYLRPYWYCEPWMSSIVDNAERAMNKGIACPLPNLDRGWLAYLGILERYDNVADWVRQAQETAHPFEPVQYRSIIVVGAPGTMEDLANFNLDGLSLVPVDDTAKFKGVVERVGFVVAVRSETHDAIEDLAEEIAGYFPVVLIEGPVVRNVKGADL